MENYFCLSGVLILHLCSMVYLPVNLNFIFAEVIRHHKESRSIEVEKEEDVGLVGPGMWSQYSRHALFLCSQIWFFFIFLKNCGNPVHHFFTVVLAWVCVVVYWRLPDLDILWCRMYFVLSTIFRTKFCPWVLNCICWWRALKYKGDDFLRENGSIEWVWQGNEHICCQGTIMNEFMMCCMEKNEGVFLCIVEEITQNVAYKLPIYFTGHISYSTGPKRERWTQFYDNLKMCSKGTTEEAH